MRLTLCSFSKRMNSTKQPTEEILAAGKTFDNVTLKELTNIDNPVLKLAGASDNDYAYNYAYIHDWGRYYHIKTADLRHEDIYHAKLELDDLATFKTQILNTEAYVIYSSSDFDRWAVDDRCPIKIKGSEIITQSDTIETSGRVNIFDFNSSNEVVILTAVASDNGLVNYVVNENILKNLTSGLCGSGISSFLDDMQKQFGDAVGSIVQIRRIPVNDGALDYIGSAVQIKLGDYNVEDGNGDPVYGRILATPLIGASGSINLSATYTDFRYTEPYSTMRISLPFIGVIEASRADFPNGVIYWQMMLDVVSGSITFALHTNDNHREPVASYSGECGMLIPIASQQIANTSGIVSSATSSAIGLGASVITGNPAPAIIGGINTIANGFNALAQRTSSVIGAYSGNRSEFLNKAFRVVTIKRKTVCEPSDLTAIEGRPCLTVKLLGNLTGYVRTQGFSIDLNANSDVIRSINSKLDAGIYIE